MYFSHVERKPHDTSAVKPVDGLFCDVFFSHMQLFLGRDSASAFVFVFFVFFVFPQCLATAQCVLLGPLFTRCKSQVLIIHTNSGDTEVVHS